MNQPNLLIILADGMQATTLEAGHRCRTEALDKLAARGVVFRRAHTTSPTCSPARASFMTGLLPHNHGVLEIEHARADDECRLRTQYPHFAQRLVEAGYRTGYFGKWHIERTEDVRQFGWQESVVKGSAHLRGLGRGDPGPRTFELDPELVGYLEGPRGYQRVLHWGVTDTPAEARYPGLTVKDAEQFLTRRLGQEEPWCCCVSFAEPNEALVVGRDAWQQYDPAAIPLPENFHDDLTDRPRIYQREQQIGRRLSEAHWRAARACYFGRITEIDELVQQLVDQVDRAGQLEQTLIVFLSDHGRYVGGHGFDAHNFGAFEEIYRIPMIIAGPGVKAGANCDALVSIADLGATLCALGGGDPLDVPDSRCFDALLRRPEQTLAEFPSGFAEYHGTRFPLMQRVLWRDNWKFVFNGFDFDELYDLDADPHEMHNRAAEPAQQDRIESMMAEIWQWVRKTGDRTILESHYLSLRLACVGPDVAEP